MGRARARTILTLQLLSARLQQDVLVTNTTLLHQVIVVPALARLEHGIRKALNGLLLLPGEHLTIVGRLPMFLSSLILRGVPVLGLIAFLVDLLHGRLHHFGARRIQIILLRTTMVVARYAHITNPRRRDDRTIILRGQRTLHLTFDLLTVIVFI